MGRTEAWNIREHQRLQVKPRHRLCRALVSLHHSMRQLHASPSKARGGQGNTRKWTLIASLYQGWKLELISWDQVPQLEEASAKETLR